MSKILIATEDAQLWETLSAEFAGLAYEPVWAATGLEALEAAITHQPTLILLAPVLAIYNGFEACTQIQADTEAPKNTPIYLLTDEEQNPHQLESAGFTGVFPETHAQHTVQELLGKLSWS